LAAIGADDARLLDDVAVDAGKELGSAQPGGQAEVGVKCLELEVVVHQAA
jgi:hypothetical protein